MKEKQSCKKVFKLFSVLLLFITNIALLGMNIQEVRAEEKIHELMEYNKLLQTI